MRLALRPREPAAYVQLRKHGYPIHHIAKVFGRSTSIVHRILSANYSRFLRKVDLRKYPWANKLKFSAFRWRNLQKYMVAWQLWALGEEGKPP